MLTYFIPILAKVPHKPIFVTDFGKEGVPVEIAISFDTTGSLINCIDQVNPMHDFIVYIIDHFNWPYSTHS